MGMSSWIPDAGDELLQDGQASQDVLRRRNVLPERGWIHG